MYLAIHQPYFGCMTVESDPILCPTCRRSNWQEFDISTCEPGQILICLGCRQAIHINWGLVQPDHLSNWLTSEKCPHPMCQAKYASLKETMGWDGQAAIQRNAAEIARLRQLNLDGQARIQKMKDNWNNRSRIQKILWWIRCTLLDIKFFLKGWKTIPEEED